VKLLVQFHWSGSSSSASSSATVTVVPRPRAREERVRAGRSGGWVGREKEKGMARVEINESMRCVCSNFYKVQ
jgi:hypothetical protein